MKRAVLFLLIAAPFGLDGCCLALRAVQAKREKPPAERISAEQSRAISAAGGGTRGTPIDWSDTKSGMRGTLRLEPSSNTPVGCNTYEQTVTLGSETLAGRVTACQQSDGSWKIAASDSATPH